MMPLTELSQRRRALLVQELERRWPGCGAHTKRNQLTRRDDVVWSDLLASQVQADIQSYIAGWEAGVEAAVRIMQDAVPFADGDIPGPTGKPSPRRTAHQDGRAARAMAGLDALFDSGRKKDM